MPNSRRLIVDGMNVIGSRPDGWWRDRPGAMRRLVEKLEDVDDYDPLSGIGREVRESRRPPQSEPVNYDGEDPMPAVWPYGLVFNVLIGVGAVAITTARLRTPSRRIARGVRIA